MKFQARFILILSSFLIALIILTGLNGCGSAGTGGGGPGGDTTPVGGAAPLNNLSGVVVDFNGNPVPLANVTVFSEPVSTKTGADGSFKLSVTPGEHSVVITKGSYVSYSRIINVTTEATEDAPVSFEGMMTPLTNLKKNASHFEDSLEPAETSKYRASLDLALATSLSLEVLDLSKLLPVPLPSNGNGSVKIALAPVILVTIEPGGVNELGKRLLDFGLNNGTLSLGNPDNIPQDQAESVKIRLFSPISHGWSDLVTTYDAITDTFQAKISTGGIYGIFKSDADQSTSTISGKITDVSGPVSGASVFAGSSYYETRADGFYYLEDVPAGRTVSLIIKAPGKLVVAYDITPTVGIFNHDINLTDRPAASMTLEANPNVLIAGEAKASTIKATVLDKYKNAVPDGTVVRFSLTAGNGMLLNTEATTTQGVATVEYQSGSTAPEDLNLNGFLDPGEDINGNGVLDGKVTILANAGGEVARTVDLTVLGITMTLMASPTSILANGSSSSAITALIKDVLNRPIANWQVGFSVTMGTITPFVQTDQNGRAVATLTSDRINGEAEISATLFPLVVKTKVAFSGVTLTGTADPNSLLADPLTTSLITVTLSDAAGIPIAGQEISFASDLAGSIITPASVLTDTAGKAKATVRSTAPGVSTIRAVHKVTEGKLGETAWTTPVTFTDLVLNIFADTISLPADGQSTKNLLIQLRDNLGNPVPDQAISLSTTLGSVTPSLVSDANGEATATFTSGTLTGTARITVSTSVGGKQIINTFDVDLTPTPPASITLMASPTVVKIGGGEQGTSTLSALVLDSNENPVKDILVTFSIAGLGGGESISPTAMTNASGIATAVYTSGVIGSKVQNDVTIQGRVASLPSPAEVKLTVGGAPHVVKVGVDITTAQSLGDGTNSVKVSAIVSDIIGNQVVDGTQVYFSIGSELQSAVINSPIATSAGKASTTLIYLSDDAGQPVTVGVESGGKTDSVTFDLPGVSRTVSTIRLSSDPPSILANGARNIDPADDAGGLGNNNQSKIEAVVSDSQGHTLGGILVNFTSKDSDGNALGSIQQSANTVSSPGPGNGVATVYLTSEPSATDKVAFITATSGVAVSPPIQVKFRGITIDLFTDATSLPADGVRMTTITATVKETTSGVPVADATVQFGTSAGTIEGSGKTDGSGRVSVTFTAGRVAQTATITAFYGIGLKKSIDLTLTPAYTISLTAAPPTIEVINDGSSSTITALVKDALLNKVPDIDVTFSITKLGASGMETDIDDPAVPLPGNQQQVTVKTDANGVATVTLTSGDTAGPVVVIAQAGATTAITIVDLTLGASDSLTLTANPSIIQADGASTSTITARLVNSNNNPIDGAAINFSTTFGSIQGVGVTDSTGKATATLTSARANQQAIIQATYGSIIAKIPVAFTGVNITVTASPGSVLADGGISKSTVTATLRDANNQPIYDQPVVFSTTLDTVSITPLALRTDVAGQIKAEVEAVSPGGVATIKANATEAGAIGQTVVTFTNSQFSLAVGSPSIVVGGGTTTVKATLLDGAGNAKVGAVVNLSTTLGSLRDSDGNPVVDQSFISGQTDENGQLTGVLTSGSVVGVATITANTTLDGDILDATTTVKITADAPASVSVVATPSAIANNGRTSTVTAAVRDGSGNPVIDQLVSFTIVVGPGGGEYLAPGAVITNGSGQAAVTFTSGALPSTFQGVKIEASVSGAVGAKVTGSAILTITGPPANVSVGYNIGELVLNPEGVFELAMAAVVTDINGNSVADGTEVTLGMQSLEFRANAIVNIDDRRIFIDPGQTYRVEDQNANGIMDSGEDGGTGFFANGKLDGKTGASVPKTLLTTDGRATFKMTYVQSEACYFNVRVTAEAAGVTNDSVFWLPTINEEEIGCPEDPFRTSYIEPASATVTTGRNKIFTINVPSTSEAYTWTATGGTFERSGTTSDSGAGLSEVTFVAGQIPGVFTVSVADSHENTLSRSVVITGPVLTISANPLTIPADSSSISSITAIIKDSTGVNVPDGTVVTFAVTALGTIDFTDIDSVTAGDQQSFSTTTTDGVATAVLTSGDTAGPVTVVATSGVGSASTVVNLTVGVTGSLALTADPTSILADGNSTSIITAILLNANNNPVANATVNFSTTSGSIAGSAITNSNGRAVVVLTSGTTPGNATITAVSESLTQKTTVTFTPSAIGTISLTAQPGAVIADGTSTSTVTATVKDSSGSILAAVPVSFNAVRNGLVTLLSRPDKEEVSSAFSSFTLALGTGSLLQSATLTAYVRNSTGDGQNNPLNVSINGITVGTISQPDTPDYQKRTLVISNPAMINTTAANTLTIQGDPFDIFDIRDVNLTFSSTQDLGTIDTDETGKAIVSVTSSRAPGMVTVTAISGAFAGSVSITQTAGSADSVVVSANPTSINADGSKSSVIEAIVTDTNGNLVVDGTTVNFNTTAGTINPASAATVNGRATAVQTSSVSAADVAATVTATEPVTGKSGTTTVTFVGLSLTVVAAPAVLDADGTSSSQITATLLNSSNNPVVGETILFTADKGRITGVGTTDGSGQVSVSYTAPVTVAPAGETATVTAKVGSLSQTAAITLNFAPVMTISASPESIEVTGGTTTSTTVTATVRDATGAAVSGATVDFTYTALSGVTLVPASGVSNAGGQVSTTLTSGTVPGAVTVTASSGQSSVSVVVNITPVGTANGLTLFANPGSIAADGVSTSTVTAVVLNATNNPIEGMTVNFATTGGTITASAVTNASGRATATLISSITPGDVTVTATVGALVQTTQVVFTAGPAASVTLAVTEASGVPNDGIVYADGSSTATVTATVVDGQGNAVDNTAVNFSSTLGTITGQVLTDAAGQAVATFMAGTVTGNAIITAQAGSATATTAITLTEAAAGSLVLSASPSSIVADGVSTSTITAVLLNATNNPIANGAITFSTDRGSIIGSAVTDGNGRAAVTLTSGSSAGTATVTASYGALAPVTVQVVFTPDATGTLTLSALPATITADGASNSTVTATVKDASGNNQENVPVSFGEVQRGLVTLLSGPAQEGVGSVSTDFTLSLGEGELSNGSLTVWTRNSSGDSLSGTLTVSINGTAVGSISQPASGGYGKQTLTLSDLSMVDTTAVGVNTLTIQGEPFDLFDLRDMNLTLTSSLDLGTSNTDASGQAVVTVTSSQAPGIVTVSAVSGALSGTVNITQRAGAADTVEVWASPASIYADGLRTSVIEATVTDANGNLVVDGTTVNFATTAGTISPASATTVNGRATAILTAGVSGVDVAATVTATEPVTGKSGTVDVTFVGLSLTVVADPMELDADGVSISSVTATLLNADNNPVSGETVLFTADKGHIIGVGTTDGSGQVSVSYTAPVTVAPAGETATVTAKVGSLSQTASIVLNFAPVMVISASPTSIEVTGGATTSSVITATVRDSSSQNVPNGTAVTFTVTALGNADITDIDSGTLGDQQTFITTTTSGVATATLESGDVAGPVTVTATSGESSATVVVNITAIGAAKNLTLFANPGSIAADGVSTSTVTAVVLNATNNPIEGETVNFVTTDGTITASAVTNSSGRATATLISSTSPGTVTVTATSGSLVQTATVVFTAGPAASVTLAVTENSGAAANDSIMDADGISTATVTATVRDANGNAVSNSVVSFSTDLGSITAQGTTNSNGQTSVTFSAGTTSGNATITAQSGSSTATTVITLTPGSAASIVVVSVSATNIAIRGSGMTDTSMLVFEVRDNKGNPVDDGQEVFFTFDGGTLGGGEKLNPAQSTTVNGRVNTILLSGYKSGTVKIRAFIDSVNVNGQFDEGEISSEAIGIAISGGLPDGYNFSLAVNPLNIAGLVTLGLTDTITAYVSDRYNNPVPDGTAIKFDSDYAGITGSSVTSTVNGSSSQAEATLTSQGPLPPDGFVVVNAGTQSGINARVLSIAVEPNNSDVVYVGTDGGGIFRSIDGGVTWIHVGNAETGLLNGIVRDVRINPTNSNIIYAATDGGVFRSGGGGEFWEERNGSNEIRGDGVGNGTGVAATEYSLTYPSDQNRAKTKVRIAGTETRNYIYTSSDTFKLIGSAIGGASGQALTIDYTVGASLPGPTYVRAVALDPSTPTTIYAAILGKGVYKSTDEGISWQWISQGMSNLNLLSLAAASSTTLYAGTMGGGLFRTTNATAASPSWTAITTLQAGVINAIAVDPLIVINDNDDLVYVGSALGGVYYSNDGSATWQSPTTNVNSADAQNTFVTDIVIDPTTLGGVNRLFAATLGDGTLEVEGTAPEGGLFRSEDGGVTWARIPAVGTPGLPNNQARALGIGTEAANSLYIGTDGRNVVKSAVAGINGPALVSGVVNGSSPTNITNNIFTTGEVLFSGPTSITITQLSDSIQGEGPFNRISNLGSQNYVYTVSDSNGNPLTAGSSIAVSVSAGSVTGDTSITLPDVRTGHTSFAVTWFNDVTGSDSVSGTLTVSVTSAANGSSSATDSRTLIKPVTITPGTATIAPSGTMTLSASGGSETTYSWSVGTGDIVPAGVNSVTYTAPAAVGEDTVTVTDDSTGQIAEATITVE